MSRSKPDTFFNGNLTGDRLAIFFLLLLLIPFFFVGGPEYHSARSVKALWDLGHIFFFFLFSHIVLDLWRYKRTKTLSIFLFLRILAIVTASGLLIELVQTEISSRQLDLFDMLRNQFGCVLYLFFYSRKNFTLLPLCLLMVVTAGLAAVALLPLTRSLYDEYKARQQFPVLSDFETPFETTRWAKNTSPEQRRWPGVAGIP